MIKSLLKYLIGLGIIVILGGLFYQKVYIPKTTYKEIHPTQGDLQEHVRAIGNLSALKIYTITAQTGGKILKLFTESGEWVKKGDLLVQMDGVDLTTQLKIAQDALKKAEFDAKATVHELTNQKAQERLLYKTYTRYKRLKEQGFVSLSEYDKAKANYESIHASLVATKEHIKSSKAAVAMAQKSIDALQEKIARLNVYAPVDGYVIERDAQEAQSVLPSQPIFKIVDPQTLWIVAKIDERISSSVAIGEEATITLRSQPQHPYSGKVVRLDAMSDPVTLEREVDIGFDVIPNPFYINEQAEVKIVVKRYSNVIKIPAKVVVQERGVLGVWLHQGNHAHFQAIQKIAQSDHEIAVENLSLEDRILIPDPDKKPLKDGMRVQP